MAVAGIGPDDDDGEAAVARPQEPAPSANGATRVAAVPLPPAPPGNVTPASLGADEMPEATAARQRIRMLIDKYDHMIKSTGDAGALAAAFETGQAEIAEIEAAGEKGKEAAQALRRKYMARMARFGKEAA